MFEGQRDNLDLWNRARFTDPKFTKTFKGRGGFSGTSTNATYVIKRATEEFGPLGIGWGWKVLESYYVDGAPMIAEDGTDYGREKIHVVKVEIWYNLNGVRSEPITCFGQTTFLSLQKKTIWKNNARAGDKETPVSDEEHAKKSLTDAITKALSGLGFSGEIHLGMWDDNKYVAQMEREAQERAARLQDEGQIVQQEAQTRAKEEAPRQGVPTVDPVVSEIANVKDEINRKTNYDDILAAAKRGFDLAKQHDNSQLHKEFKKCAKDRWEAIKARQAGIVQ